MNPYIFGMSMLQASGRVWEQQMRVTQVLVTAAMRHNLALAGFGRLASAPVQPAPKARRRPAAPAPRLVVAAPPPACSVETRVNNLPV